MPAGRLKHSVTLRYLTAGQDAAGQPVQTWADLATVMADIVHKTGVQAIRADADVSIVQASIRIRRRSDVTVAMRAVHGTAVYDIKSVLPDARSRLDMFLVCELAT